MDLYNVDIWAIKMMDWSFQLTVAFTRKKPIPIYVFMDAKIHGEHPAPKKRIVKQRSIEITSETTDH